MLQVVTWNDDDAITCRLRLHDICLDEFNVW